MTRFNSLLLVAFLGFGCRARAGEEQTPPTEEEQPRRITLWTPNTELYLEHPPLVEGLPAKLAVHLTALGDFRPITEGQLVVRFRPATGQGFETKADQPTSPGIFGPVVTAPAAGVYQVDLLLTSPQGNDSIRLPTITVYTPDDDIPLGAAPAEGIAFLKEQQWKTEGFRTAFADQGRLRATLEVSGELGAAAGRQAVLAAPVAGVLEPGGLRGAPVPGQRVRAGQVLAVLTPTLSDLGGGYAAARARFQEATHEHARAKRLVEAEAAPARRLEEAVLRLEAARAELAAFGGAESSDSSGRLILRAPIRGTVVERRAVPGGQVEAGASLFSIVDPSTMWLTARVPANEIARVGRAPRARFSIDGASETWPTGRLLSSSPMVDSASRTVALLFEVDNRSAALRIGATARVAIEQGEVVDGVIVPNGALVEEDGRSVAYIQVSGERFERRELVLGGRQADRFLVRQGIKAGERVVIGAAYQVRLASLSTAVPDHGHEH